MKLVDLKNLKQEDNIYKKILNELKIKGLNDIDLIYKKSSTIDYLDIFLDVTDLIEKNKNLFKNLTQEQYENILIICVDEIFEHNDIDISEEQLEKILKLLKNNLLVQKLSSWLWEQAKNAIVFIKSKLYVNGCC